MRLSEDMIAVLTALARSGGQAAQSSLAQGNGRESLEDALHECEAEGLLVRGESGELRLTDAGCARAREIERRLTSADRLGVGEQARVIYVGSRNYPRFQKLTSLGFAPGVPIKIRQKFPSFVVQCEETQIALEAEIARDIFVWREAN